MKRKESDRAQSLKLQSFSYLKVLEDAEPWQNLNVHGFGSNESNRIFESMHNAKYS